MIGPADRAFFVPGGAPWNSSRIGRPESARSFPLQPAPFGGAVRSVSWKPSRSWFTIKMLQSGKAPRPGQPRQRIAQGMRAGWWSTACSDAVGRAGPLPRPAAAAVGLARAVRHGRAIAFQLAEAAVTGRIVGANVCCTQKNITKKKFAKGRFRQHSGCNRSDAALFRKDRLKSRNAEGSAGMHESA